MSGWESLAKYKASSKWEPQMGASIQKANENTQRDMAKDKWHFWTLSTALYDTEVKKINSFH